VPQHHQHAALHQELAAALRAAAAKLLHGHLEATATGRIQPAPVHPAEPALAHQVRLREPARGHGQLRQRELAGGRGAAAAAAAYVDGALGLGRVAGGAAAGGRRIHVAVVAETQAQAVHHG